MFEKAPRVELPFGRGNLTIEITEGAVVPEIRIGSPGEPAFREAGRTVLPGAEAGEDLVLLVPDHTRALPRGAIGSLLGVLAGRGIGPKRIIIAGGNHEIPPQTFLDRIQAEAGGIVVLPHDAGGRHLPVGRTTGGILVEIMAEALECDRLLVLSSVSFHYLAGFGGGPKMIVPGIASRETIFAVHRRSFRDDLAGPMEGTGPGRAADNPFREAIIEAASLFPRAVEAVTLSMDRLFTGGLIDSHEKAVSYLSRNATRELGRKFSDILVSAGGHPYDSTLYQAQKAIQTALTVSEEGGRITLFAACPDGLGPDSFADALALPDTDSLRRRLDERFDVPSATALTLRLAARRRRISILSEGLPADPLRKAGIEPLDRESGIPPADLVLKHGSRLLPVADPPHHPINGV